MSYVAAGDRYDQMRYNRCGRERARAPCDLARALAQLRRHHARSRRAVRSCGAPSTSASPTSTSRTTTARRTARPRRTSAGSCGTTSGPTATSSSSRRRPATTCGPARTATAARASTCSRASTRASPRLGLDYVDIFYSHRVDPSTPLEETMGALDSAVRQGKALYVGISSYSAEKTTRGSRDPARPRHAAPDPPAVVLDAEPLDRAGPGRDARRARRGVHHVLAARPGRAHRPLPATASRRARARAATTRSRPRRSREETLAKVQGAERDRRRRAVSRSPRWRSPGRCATRGSPRRSSARAASRSSSRTSARSTTSSSRRRARRDRRSRARERRQHLGGVERPLSGRSGRRRWSTAASARATSIVSEIALGSWLTFGGGIERDRARRVRRPGLRARDQLHRHGERLRPRRGRGVPR